MDGIACGNCANTQGLIFCENNIVYCPVCNTYSERKSKKTDDQANYINHRHNENNEISSISSANTVVSPAKASQSSTNNVKTPTRGKPRAGKVIAIIVCAVFFTYILPLIIAVANNHKENTVPPSPTTEITEPRINNNSGSNNPVDYGENVTGNSSPSTEYTPEQPKWVYLTDLTPYSGLPFSKLGESHDIFGNEYTCSLRGYRDEDSAIWRLNGEYTTLTFTIGVPGLCRGSNPDWYSGSIRVYCDGEIVYEKTGIDSLTESEFVTIDVSNCKDLKIQICADYYYLEPAVFEPVLYR